jgi:carbon storage regulator
MLVLSRKPTERIQIGDSVVVTVLEIMRNRVRIGIDAPEHIHVLRSELQDYVSEASGSGARATVAPIGSCDSCGIEAWETEGGACG